MFTAIIAGAAAGLASIPHCTAMCGPLAAYSCAGSDGAEGQFRYQLGRFLSYSMLGVIVGGLGGAVAISLPKAWGSALLSWSLALGLGLAAYRLWQRPRTTLVQLTAKQPDGSHLPEDGLVARLGRHPFAVGLATALLPCGALASAALIAASTGNALEGALSMLAFSIVSGAGLVGASWLFNRVARRPNASTIRVLAVVLALGAIVFVLRPMHALDHGAHDHGVEHGAHP